MPPCMLDHTPWSSLIFVSTASPGTISGIEVCVLKNLFRKCWWILLSLPQHHLDTTSVAAVAESLLHIHKPLALMNLFHFNFILSSNCKWSVDSKSFTLEITSSIVIRLVVTRYIIFSIHWTSDHITSRNDEREGMQVVLWCNKLLRSTEEFKKP